jgi:hypothetical protein
MPKRNPPPKPDEPGTPKRSFNLFAQHNRGLLLDIVVFIANLFLMHLFTGFVIDLFKLANENNSLAKFALISGCVAMWVLPAAGAVMKRWHFHQRLAHEKKSLAFDDKLSGCLFNPIFYFCLNLVVMSAIVAALGQELVGKKGMDSGAYSFPTIFIGLAATIFQTYLIYRYFIPPKKPPKSEFLRRPESELLGDVCFFFNMLMFQAAWNLLTFADLGRVSGIGEFLGRLFFSRLSRCSFTSLPECFISPKTSIDQEPG